MRTILIACRSQETAECAMRVAADISAACGARLALVHVPEAPRVLTAAAGVDAIGRLSDVLFTEDDPRRPFRSHRLSNAPDWLGGMSERVGECVEVRGIPGIVAAVAARCPDLVVTCDPEIADALVAKTRIPVWRLRPGRGEPSWFLVRKLRCSVRGSRAAEWARSFAALLGADVETMPAGLFKHDAADLVVVAREERAPLLRARLAGPVVVV